MQVKKYVGDSMQDVIWKVKADLGPEAVIIHSRKFKEGGFLGIWGAKEKVEVVAALTEQDSKNNPIKLSEEQHDESKKQEKSESDKHFYQLQNQIAELKTFMTNMASKSPSNNRFTSSAEKLYSFLLNNEVDNSLAEKILEKIQEDIPAKDLSQEEKVKSYLDDYFQEIIKIGDPIKTQKGKRNLIALIGPTGVGKTTTLAKLTAYFSLMQKKDVVLLTADTYRIAAVEQLKTYGEIMDIPVEAVYTPEELQDAVERYKEKEIILLDTAGRSQKNSEQMLELKEFLQAVEPEEVYLVLSATTRFKDLQDIVYNFAQVGFDKIIFTKLDETTSYGPVISLLNYMEKPVVYLTMGQNVPDDIKPANHQDLINPLLERLSG